MLRGHLQVVTNWSGEPVCIIEITSVSKCKYNEITAEFAALEGEGDKTLAGKKLIGISSQKSAKNSISVHQKIWCLS